MSFSETTQQVYEALEAIATATNIDVRRWTGQEAFVPPACWIASANLARRENTDQCSKRHDWTYELRFAVDQAATANRELSRLEEIVDVASLELENRCARPNPFGGRTAEITSARITDPTTEGVAAFVVRLTVAIRIQHEIPTP